MNQETLQFISQNKTADVHQLALQASRFSDVDMPFAVRQINGLQKVKHKIPLFYNTDNILFPVQLSLEQSSSESTAKYKSTLCEGNLLIDLTGGFGIDCCFMSAHFKEAIYVERNTELCELATHNFKVMNKQHIDINNTQTEDFLTKNTRKADWIFIDPARRSSAGKKLVLLSDCEPDVALLYPTLLEQAQKVMIKLSPMMDITAATKELPTVSEIHIISVENECKEVLLILDQDKQYEQLIKTVHIRKDGSQSGIQFLTNEEQAAIATYTNEVLEYLYEPDSSVMKSGAFKLISEKFKANKLHINSHLYTSSECINEFPGRAFKVSKVWKNSKQNIKELSVKLKQANISTRNFPLSPEELRKKLKIKDGGETYLFATTLNNSEKVIIETYKLP
ncbi:MAG: hypothetical protein RIS29_3362 [Bacteroidota bacterium]|jgi:16S rRNA G966 N2-methylase RsmD